MKRLALLTALFLLAFAASGSAADLAAEKAWARASMGAGTTGAVFLELRNAGSEDLTIVSAATPLAEKAELHTHIMNEGVMQMRQVEELLVPAGGMLMLQPGGDHVMLFGVTQPLKEGESFELTLTSKSGEEITFPVMVMSPTHMGDGVGHGSDQGGEGGHQMPMQPQN